MNRKELESLMENYSVNIEDVKHVLTDICFNCLSDNFSYYLSNSKYYKVMILLLELYSDKCNRYVNSQFITDEVLEDFGISQKEIEESW